MKKLFCILMLCFSLCHAQRAAFERDSILTTKDTIVFSIQNNMMTSLYVLVQPKKIAPKSIRYATSVLVPAKEKKSFMHVPRSILSSYDALFDLGKYFNYKIGFGNPETAKPNKDYIYLLPYKNFKKLIQGNFGKFTHSDGVADYYAFDFGTQIGDTIYAAREGKVVMIKEDSKKYGASPKYISYANYITIEHDDGTTASYVHLHYNGVLVENGEIVERGQAIGISGLTGFTTTPHVHFVVHTPTKKYGNVSIPIEFEGYVGKKLRTGYSYTGKKQ
jgi:murein DD-endopeptidase MepM/ murein hydrolase activator NlpD